MSISNSFYTKRQPPPQPASSSCCHLAKDTEVSTATPPDYTAAATLMLGDSPISKIDVAERIHT